MCVLICANSKVREWLDISLARDCRRVLQLCSVSSAASESSTLSRNESAHAPTFEAFDAEEKVRQRVMTRSAWVQAFFRYSGPRAQRSHYLNSAESRNLSHEWQKTFEAIAKTWGRLLSLLGLCW